MTLLTLPLVASCVVVFVAVARVVYALPEHTLAELTGSDERNLTMSLPCREVFARGQRKVQVYGPYMVEKAKEPHIGAWS